MRLWDMLQPNLPVEHTIEPEEVIYRLWRCSIQINPPRLPSNYAKDVWVTLCVNDPCYRMNPTLGLLKGESGDSRHAKPTPGPTRAAIPSARRMCFLEAYLWPL